MGLRAKLFLSHFLAVALVSGSVGSFFYYCASRSLFNALRTRLMNTAAIVAETIDARGLEAVRTPDDASNVVYRTLLQQLRDFRAADPDIAFMYIMRRTGDAVTFVVDTDETEGQALPGEVYDTAVPALFEGFARPAADTEIVFDKWGASLSGYAPIRGELGRLCLGLDMRANQVARVQRNLRVSGLGSLLCAVLLALLFSGYLAVQMLTPLHLLMERCVGVAEGRLGEAIVLRTHDEFDGVIQAFNRMSSYLADAQHSSHTAASELSSANALLEQRVQERTRELQELNEQLGRAVLTDPLTGAWNRRAALDDMRRRADAGQPFAILVGDLDHFKRINDSHGHLVGDEALRAAANRIQASVDPGTHVARWGGEEFLVLVSVADVVAAAAVAERIRAGLEREPFFTRGADLRLTISVGVAICQVGDAVESRLRAADRALFHAKRNGRNRVETAQASDVGPD